MHPNDSRGQDIAAGRKYKRFARKNGADSALYQAHLEGSFLAEFGPQRMPPRLRQNPYPPGRRHDAWVGGFGIADVRKPLR